MYVNSCRICLNSNEFKLVDIFERTSVASLAEKIKFCAGIEVTEQDELPQKLCTDCSEKLHLACEFKQLACETDKLLRTRLKSENPEIMQDPHEQTDLLFNMPKQEAFECSDIKGSKFDGTSSDIELPVTCMYDENSESDAKRKHSDNSNLIRKKKSLDLECFICRATFDRVYEKRQHIIKTHSDISVCHVCQKKQKSPITVDKCLGDHIYGFRGFICSSCGKKFRRAHQLATHYNLDHEDISKQEIYYCDVCGRKFRYKGTLSKHIRLLHLHAKQFRCPHSDICPNVSYATKDSLKLHLYRKHDLKAPYSCSLCNLGFNYECELEMHCKKRTCKKGFSKGTTIRKYCEKTESGYACKFQNCTRVFSEKQLWSFHYNAYHRDNKSCTLCNKEFSSFSAYHKHKEVQHNNVKKFVCDFPGCLKAFGQRSALLNHVNTHSGNKPFSCDYEGCDFRSGDRSSVYKHKKKVHYNQ